MSHDIWSIILIIGLIGWISSTLFFIFSSFPARGEFHRESALKWGICVMVTFGIWVIGLINA